MNYDDPDPPRVYYKFKPTRHERLTDKDKEAHPEPIEVKQILRENLIVEEAKLAKKPEPRRWRSRRNRDYLIMITVPNAIVALITFGIPNSPFPRWFGLSVMALYSVTVTWVMLFVMDRD